MWVLFFLIAHTFAGVKEDLLSPLTTEASYVLWTGGAMTTALAIGEDAWVDPAQKEATEDHPLGKYSRYGDWAGQMVPNLLYMGINAVGGKSDRPRAMRMLRATAYASLVTTVIKYTLREPRPDGSAHNSFPSGHTTTVFAFAGVVTAEHAWYWGVAANMLGGFVAYSRMNDNKHWLHDVVGGATIGLSYGLAIPWLDRKKSPSDGRVVMTPVGRDGYALAYTRAW